MTGYPGDPEDSRIVDRNPWWFHNDWTAGDPHLRRLEAQPLQLPARLVGRFDLAHPGVHTIRGPRQVGKSTDLKLLVRRFLEEGRAPRRVIYLALDLLEGQPPVAVSETIERAKRLAAADGPSLLLLDEVSAVPGWQIAIKELWDRGVIDDDIVVCTGSSAVDIARGAAERLPGRRGHGLDHVVLPQSFDAFATAVDGDIPPSPRLTLDLLMTQHGREVIEDSLIYASRIERAFMSYLRFGGLPAAVVEAAAGAAEPSELTRRILWDSFLREVVREGASEPAARALLERVIRSLGSKTNWSAMAREMDVPLVRGRGRHPDSRTVRDYIEFLANGYFVMVVYFWKNDSDSNALARDKKLYFGDLLLHEIAHDECSPGREVDVPALVENAVALALYRNYEPMRRQVIGFLDPDDLHVWSTSTGTEVDFVCGPRATVHPVEVKWVSRLDRRELSRLKRSFPHRPIVIATRSELEFASEHALIPVPLLLWALGDPASE
jgi:predicted AAA+ superfamily ATPase